MTKGGGNGFGTYKQWLRFNLQAALKQDVGERGFRCDYGGGSVLYTCVFKSIYRHMLWFDLNVFFGSQLETCGGMYFFDTNAGLQSFPLYAFFRSLVLTLNTNRKLTSQIQTVFKWSFLLKEERNVRVKFCRLLFKNSRLERETARPRRWRIKKTTREKQNTCKVHLNTTRFSNILMYAKCEGKWMK